MNVRKATLASALVAAGLLVPAFSSGIAGAAPGDAMCHVTSENPHASKGSPGWIVGKGRISCTAAIDSVEVLVQLEQLIDGKWVAVGQTGRNPQDKPKANTQYTAQGQMECRPGTFRTAARGSGVYGGRPSGSMAWQYSQTVTDPCN